MMLIKRLIQTTRADAQLPSEVRAALVESLFAPIASLAVGAVACSIIGAAVALRVGDSLIMLNSIAILAVGMLRVASAALYKRQKRIGVPTGIRLWEHIYESGAWGFSALLGLLCWITITQTADTSLQMAVTTMSAGYAAAISGRNAGRPFIALGQLTLTSLPMAIALLIYPDWLHKALGFVVLLFVYGMMDITLSIRDIIIQALTMTRKEAALAARFEEQANRFDVALNNMSHGLCMLDRRDRLMVWNTRFLELLDLQNAPVRVGMPIPELARYSVRAGHHEVGIIKEIFGKLARGLQQEPLDQIQFSLNGERTIALSRRMMSDGGAVIILEDVTERKRAQERIAHLARFDALTGLANRTQFHERIKAMLAATRNREAEISVQLIDLDRFKSVNDTLGHPIGDKLLKEAAYRLGSVVGPNDMITRFGGDEFVVLQDAPGGPQDAERLARRLIGSLASTFDIDGHRIDIGGSIGIAMAPVHGIDADQLLKKADMALYAAKKGGGGSHYFFAAELEETAQKRRALELDLREAIANDEFHLHFQPLVNLRTGVVSSCEALVRWSHPVRGDIPPSVFIPVAEETGLIVPLGEWILQRACLEAAKWPNGVKVAVNLSAVQFRDRGLALKVVGALAKSGLPAQRLEMEITERLLLEESDITLATMQQFKELGVCISLDDFGTGYSSLNYLRKFPFHKIKIDQAFIHDLGKNSEGCPIIRAVANLGEDLNMVVVAEGIETEEQMKLVAAQGCTEGQGYFFGAPMSGESICAYLEMSASQAQFVA